MNKGVWQGLVYTHQAYTPGLCLAKSQDILVRAALNSNPVESLCMMSLGYKLYNAFLSKAANSCSLVSVFYFFDRIIPVSYSNALHNF